MSKQQDTNFKRRVIPLYMNGLRGRMLYIPSQEPKKTKQILMLYGRRASLERYFPLAELLSDYGTVSMPDLPGFGGMESFYKLGEKPTLDNLADYLAAFIKLRYKKRRLTIFGVSTGFVVATRMLQKYPDLAKKVDLVISVGGFTRRDDFTFSKSKYWLYRLAAWWYSLGFVAWFTQSIILQPACLKLIYAYKSRNDSFFKGLSVKDRNNRINSEIKLWHANDFRTYAYTSKAILKMDLTNKQLNVPVYHLPIKDYPLINNAVVEQHMRIAYKDYDAHYIGKVSYYYDHEIPNLRAFVREALKRSSL